MSNRLTKKISHTFLTSIAPVWKDMLVAFLVLVYSGNPAPGRMSTYDVTPLVIKLRQLQMKHNELNKFL